MAKKAHPAKNQGGTPARVSTTKKARGATGRWDAVTETLASGGVNLVLRNGKSKDRSR